MFKLRFLGSTKKTFEYLAILTALLLVFFTIFIVIYSDAFYTCCSDDLLQYFKIEEEFALKLKTGQLSFYNFSNYLGASFYSDTYYIQFDLFTLISVLLSFFMPFELAFGITELIKLFLGTLMFGYFLYLRKCSNKAILVASLIYFICGYNSCMMAFSGFFSLVFYYPFAAVCLEKYKSGNKFLLPLCSAILVFYNFYLGACTMLFMGMWFILSYFLDNKLQEIKDVILKNDPNAKHVTSKALLIYLGKGFKSGFICAGYMIIGIMIATIILLPSLSFFLTDSFPRNDHWYKWSFTFKDQNGKVVSTMAKMYARILGNLFSPTYSTDFYGFVDDYITDHNSLYITITGLMILLFVFKLKDRESKIYKVALIVEVLLLIFPITYMIFSLNNCPYTRWFGMLNFLNLLVVAHVITKTDFKFDFLSVKSIATDLVLLGVIVLVINFYLKSIYGTNILQLLSGKKLTVKNERLVDMKYDVILMLVGAGIVILTTAMSGKKLQSKFNIMPYVLAFELCLGFGFMFEPKVYNYNTLWFAERKEELNSYLNKTLESPYDTNSNFSRTHVKSFITDDFVNADNYGRTNLYLSDLRIFHSFYDCNTNDLVRMFYDLPHDINNPYTPAGNGEERNSKMLLNEYSLFVQTILANRYIVTDSNEYEEYYFDLPSKYFKFLDDDETFRAYENINYTPFMIYDKKISESDYYNGDTHLAKQQYALNYLSLYNDDMDKILLDKATPSVETTHYTIPLVDSEELRRDDRNMVGYVIAKDGYTIPNEGIMHFYFNGGQGARSVTFCSVELEFEDGSRVNGLSGYAYYEEKPKIIWIEKNSNFDELNNKTLYVEFSDYSEYDNYINRMANDYSNLSLKIDSNKLHLSYHRNDDKNNVIVLPISYNDCWENDGNYEMIKTYGGLLGIVVPQGGNDINITLTFKARYVNASALISITGTILYALVLVNNYRRVKKDEEDYNYCSVL